MNKYNPIAGYSMENDIVKQIRWSHHFNNIIVIVDLNTLSCLRFFVNID
jgi:hypothetical protein